ARRHRRLTALSRYGSQSNPGGCFLFGQPASVPVATFALSDPTSSKPFWTACGFGNDPSLLTEGLGRGFCTSIHRACLYQIAKDPDSGSLALSGLLSSPDLWEIYWETNHGRENLCSM